MTTLEQTHTEAAQDLLADKVRKVQELYADAPEVAKAALKDGLAALKQELGAPTQRQTAGRIGARQGKVSEFTAVFPLAPDGAKRLRGLLDLLEGNFKGADLVGTVHDMRFVFIDNDTKCLFATAYDGDWDPYIDDFATKIPNAMDLVFSNAAGWPGIRSSAIKDFLLKYQVPAAAWYVANPNLTVAETRKLARVGKAVDELLDKVQ